MNRFIETYAYSKDLECRIEEIKCTNIVKYKND